MIVQNNVPLPTLVSVGSIVAGDGFVLNGQTYGKHSNGNASNATAFPSCLPVLIDPNTMVIPADLVLAVNPKPVAPAQA